MTLTIEQRNKYAMLRMSVYANLDRYFSNGFLSPVILAELLGYNKDFNTMRDNFTARDVRLCQALAGPYGYTIYRMLLAQNQPPK